jgi:GAF domain-containing protein
MTVERTSEMPFTRTEGFAALARELATQPSLAATLQAVVEHAAAITPGAEDAAITVKHGTQRYETVASTGELPLRVDAIQYLVGEGPCLQALEQHHVIRSDDLGADDRWPTFGSEVTAKTEVVSMMSHRLFLEDSDSIGALNLYSRKSAAFADLELTALADLATHCAVALTTVAEREQNQHLKAALETNRDIGVAIGILMATKLVTKQQAFDALRITSQHTHRKLHLVALDVIESGELPRFVPGGPLSTSPSAN